MLLPRLFRADAIAGIPGLGNPGAPTEEKEPLAPVGGDARVIEPPANALLRGLMDPPGPDILLFFEMGERKTEKKRGEGREYTEGWVFKATQ